MGIFKVILYFYLLLVASLSANNESIRLLIKTAKGNENPAVRTALLKGMLKGLEGQTNIEAPEGWKELNAELITSEVKEHKSLALQIGQIFGDENASAKAFEILKSTNANLKDRKESLKSLVAQKNQDLSKLLPSLLKEKELQIHAIRAYGKIPNANSEELLVNYKEFEDQAKKAVIETLSTREDLAKKLLAALKNKIISKSEIPAYTARALNSILGDEFKEIYGEIQKQSDSKKEIIAKYSALLDLPEASKADPILGRKVFKNVCGTCHQMYGEGGILGPDLTGSNRANREYILLNIVDPNFDVPDGYKMIILKTINNRVLAGTIAEEDEQKVVLKSVTGKEIISKDEIKDRQKLAISMMPEGILETISKNDFYALIKYLQIEEKIKIP
ncbi:MAG: hypothetical protein CMO46_01335 [Verrucomicrobiales bacterium]|nr:hypothetical protein [Verrucomicrobiales bacterium]